MSGRQIGILLDEESNTMMKNYNTKSSVSYLPNNSVVTSTDVGYVIKDMENGLLSLEMTPLNGGQLYTHETCKLQLATTFSDILYTEQEEIRTGTITKTQGLSYNVIVSNNNNNNDGYFHDNHAFFVNNINDIKYTGISNPINLTSIRTQHSSTEGFPTDRFSVEWFGYVIPSKSESVKFSIESDDASYLWFGNKAIYDYNIDNATINNGGQHGMEKKEITIQLNAGEIYPIRIQYGEYGGGDDFILKINDQDTYDGLYTLKKHGKIYEQKQLYYALVEDSVDSTNKKLFKCFSYTTNGINEINAKKIVLNMLSTRVTGSTNRVEYESISISNGTGSSAEIGNNGFHLYKNGILTSSIQTNFSNIPIYWLDLVPTIETDGSVRCHLDIKGLIYDNGTRRYKSTLVHQLWNENYKDSAPSQILMVEKKTKGRNIYLFQGQKLTKNNPLISNDYMFKVTLSDQGQLVLLRAKLIKINTKDQIRYTKPEVNKDTKYLYNLRCDYRMNKTFVSDNINKTLKFVPSNSKFLGFRGFKEFNNYLPSTTDGETQYSSGTITDVKTMCTEQCKKDIDCNAVYVYTKKSGNTNWCKLVKEDKQNIMNNNVFNNIQPTSDIISSTLYNKEKKMPSQISTSSFSSKDDYARYPLSEYKITDKLTEAIPSIENTPEYKGLIIKYGDSLGNAAPMNLKKEPFTPYNPYDCTDKDCKAFIQTQKIDPLIKTATDYSKTLQSMNANNTTFSNNLTTYDNTYTNLSSNRVYQFRAEHTDFNNKPKSVLETANDDLDELLIQQNNMYIIGTITTATLLITAILLSSS